MGQYSAGPINKAVPSITNSLTEYLKSGGSPSEHFVYSKSVHTYGVSTDLNSRDRF